MYLQLAESGNDPYISVPTSQGLIKVREDYFDDLSPAEWEKTMDRLAPFQPSSGLSELSDKETRRRRKEARTQKKEAKSAKKAAKAEDIKSGARSERRKAIFGKVTDTIGGVVGKFLPGGDQSSVGPEVAPEVQQESSGLPKWVIPVGIGVAGIGLVYFLTKKK